MMLFLPLFLILSQTKAEDVCMDPAGLRFTIIQKIDDHTYEMRTKDLSPMAYILKTKKATFNGPGEPIGVYVQWKHKEMKVLSLQNGFLKNYIVLTECALSQLPRLPMPDWSVRNHLPEDDHQ